MNCTEIRRHTLLQHSFSFRAISYQHQWLVTSLLGPRRYLANANSMATDGVDDTLSANTGSMPHAPIHVTPPPLPSCSLDCTIYVYPIYADVRSFYNSSHCIPQDKKGVTDFLRGKVKRLGVPFIFFNHVLGPVWLSFIQAPSLDVIPAFQDYLVPLGGQ